MTNKVYLQVKLVNKDAPDPAVLAAEAAAAEAAAELSRLEASKNNQTESSKDANSDDSTTNTDGKFQTT